MEQFDKNLDDLNSNKALIFNRVNEWLWDIRQKESRTRKSGDTFGEIKRRVRLSATIVVSHFRLTNSSVDTKQTVFTTKRTNRRAFNRARTRRRSPRSEAHRNEGVNSNPESARYRLIPWRCANGERVLTPRRFLLIGYLGECNESGLACGPRNFTRDGKKLPNRDSLRSTYNIRME